MVIQTRDQSKALRACHITVHRLLHWHILAWKSDVFLWINLWKLSRRVMHAVAWFTYLVLLKFRWTVGSEWPEFVLSMDFPDYFCSPLSLSFVIVFPLFCLSFSSFFPPLPRWGSLDFSEHASDRERERGKPHTQKEHSTQYGEAIPAPHRTQHAWADHTFARPSRLWDG